ncbi:MAG TPA: tripartite tricarboxylate transporter TctB family protein [Hyphomicrobiaceae bacterium]|nr:tripartite tricarboxylate transporter TctB family protein [Hyphomicrobiaceae bacterium]
MGRLILNSEVIGAGFWFILGGIVAWLGYDLGIGKLNEPGPGGAIFWLGLGMVGLGAVVLVQTLASGAGQPVTTLWHGTRWPKIIAIVAALLILGYFFETVGFIILVLGLLLLCMFFIDPVRWWVAIPVALIATVGIWGVMTEVLRIQLPGGILAEPIKLPGGIVIPAIEDHLRAHFRVFLKFVNLGLGYITAVLAFVGGKLALLKFW